MERNLSEIAAKNESRIIHLERVHNIRGLGGIKIDHGKTIGEHLMIRSASLSDASEKDIQTLTEQYHLSVVLDIRTEMEQQQNPDVNIDRIEFISSPLFDQQNIGVTHEKETQAKRNQTQSQIPSLKDVYIKMIKDEKCRNNIGRIIRIIMEHDYAKGSILWHCTAGKDRCGVITAVILYALSVDMNTIKEDYLLTNMRNIEMAEMIYQKKKKKGYTEEKALQFKNLFLAEESCLDAFFDSIKEDYADFDEFLTKGLKIPYETFLHFRNSVLK